MHRYWNLATLEILIPGCQIPVGRQVVGLAKPTCLQQLIETPVQNRFAVLMRIGGLNYAGSNDASNSFNCND